MKNRMCLNLDTLVTSRGLGAEARHTATLEDNKKRAAESSVACFFMVLFN
jgi:hypothetical protein